MIDIKVNKALMQIDVIQNGKTVKTESLDKDSFKSYMHELADDDMLDGLRVSTRLFKPSYYEFKDVKI